MNKPYVLSNATVVALSATGAELGRTGGMLQRGNTEAKVLAFFVRKTKGMIARGYFTGAVTLRVELTAYTPDQPVTHPTTPTP